MICSGREKACIDAAVKLIRSGEVVAFPTETVYGLGADALNESAVRKIFEVKKRPFFDPLIVHVGSSGDLDRVCEEVPTEALKLIKRFWPGPLTLVLRKKNRVPSVVTAGLDTVAVRMPRHLMALALIKNSECCIAAPSANRFQSMSPTTAEAVQKELGDDVGLIVDGGPCLVGMESTVVSFEGDVNILRVGGIAVEDIEEVLGRIVPVVKKVKTVEAPGMLEFHYAPRKPLSLVSKEELRKVSKKQTKGASLLVFSKVERKSFEDSGFKEIIVLSERGSMDEAAKNFFATLRQMDESNAEKIFALKVPEERLGLAINDRLKKAQHE